jgi:hypothetical protein
VLALLLTMSGCGDSDDDSALARPRGAPGSPGGADGKSADGSGGSPVIITEGTGGASGSQKSCDPGAFDYPGNGIDEDCSGVADDEPFGCDGDIPDIGYGDPMAAARALGLCRVQAGSSWGVVSARYVLANGAPGMHDVSHGLLPAFGPNVAVREGQAMLALSSGTARRPGDPGFRSPRGAELFTKSPMPPGFPIPSPSCPGVLQLPVANDSAALELVIRVPTNARGFGFDFNFYTYEFPDYICSPFNDFFVALVSPAPEGSQHGNVSFDAQGNPVSVNNGLLQVCKAQHAGGKPFSCPLGSAELAGTGYDELAEFGPHAATGWLVTRAPVTPGSEVTIRFAIWDAGDHVLDSLVLIDNFVWEEAELPEGPLTEPVK